MSNLSVFPERTSIGYDPFVSSERFQSTADALVRCQEYADAGGLHIIDGPLVAAAVLKMCSRETDMATTKSAGDYLGSLVVAGALERFSITKMNATVMTPNDRELTMDVLPPGAIDFILIPRAALAFQRGIDTHVPSANQYFYGMARDEETLEPRVYMDKVPKDLTGKNIIIADTMLATGGSAEATINMAYERNAKSVKVLAMIPSPQGIAYLTDVFASEDFEIACPPLHWGLNDKGFIVPGLGDAGDRRFGAFAI